MEKEEQSLPLLLTFSFIFSDYLSTVNLIKHLRGISYLTGKVAPFFHYTCLIAGGDNAIVYVLSLKACLCWIFVYAFTSA